MSNLRILVLNSAIIDGGVEIILQTMVEYFKKKGYRVTVVAKDIAGGGALFGPSVRCFRTNPDRKEYKKQGIPSLLNKLYCKVLGLMFIIVLSLYNYDVLIALKEGTMMKKGAPIRAKRKFAWIHSDYFYTRQTLVNKVFPSFEKEKKCMQRYEKVVCVSETTRNSVIQTIGDPGNLCIKYNPINVKKILAMAQEHCSMTRDDTCPLLVSVGRLSKEKNYPVLLKACAELHKKIKFNLWIIGDGRERKDLEEYIAKNQMDFVTLLGSNDNPYPLMKQADVYVSASISESYGLAVQEALILNLPVVAVNCSGIKESLDPRFGILVDNSVTQLCGALERILTDSALLSSYKQTIASEYHTEQLYEERMEDICKLWEDTK